jgi:hypothetical protein
MKSFKQFLIENIILSPEIETIFHNLAQQQRDKPEKAMLNVQDLQLSQLYTYALEHVGDINHRMNEHINFFNGQQGTILKKLRIVKNDLENIPRYVRNINKQIEDNRRYIINSNPNHPYKELSVDDLKNILRQKAEIYANEHKKLKVYNHIQWLARQSAVELGLMNFPKAKQHIDELYSIVDNDDSFLQHITQYNPNYSE